MSQVINVSSDGFTVNVLDVDDTTGAHHRHALVPGGYINGTWTAANLSAETQAVQAAAGTAWTPAVIAAYQAAFPYVPPPALTQDQQNILAILNNPRRQALLTAALAANDQQILNYVAAQVTNLPTAITYLQNLTLIVLAVIRS